jgi:hypothetical protein
VGDGGVVDDGAGEVEFFEEGERGEGGEGV